MDTSPDRSKLLRIAGFSALLGVLWVYLFFMHKPGLNYPLFVLATILSGLMLARIYTRKLTRVNYALLGLAALFSLMVFVRASMLLTFFNILGSGLLLLLFVASLRAKKFTDFLVSDYAMTVLLPFRFLRPYFSSLPIIFSFDRSVENSKTKEIVRGLIMAAVALVIFSWLFASADAGFHALVSTFFSFQITDEWWGRLILWTFISSFLLGGFGFIFLTSEAPKTNVAVADRKLGELETIILLGSINALFLLFIGIQISYLFGGLAHLQVNGLTYAEYAREGFVQLVVVAVLSFLIIYFAQKQIKQTVSGHLISFKALSGFLVLEVIVILVSAFSRLSLYEDAYGFTTIRLYSHALMIWIAVAAVLLLVHIWKNGRPSAFIFNCFCTVVALLVVMNALNPDAFIARKNLERYAASGKIDAAYLASLSSDSWPITFSLLNDTHADVQKEYAHGLYWNPEMGLECQGDTCPLSSYTDWQSSHVRTLFSAPLSREHFEILKENRGLPSSSVQSSNP